MKVAALLLAAALAAQPIVVVRSGSASGAKMQSYATAAGGNPIWTVDAPLYVGSGVYLDFLLRGGTVAQIETDGAFALGQVPTASLRGTCRNGEILWDSTAAALKVCSSNTWSTLGAPAGTKYLVQQADAALPNAQAMGALGTGLVLNATSTGVQSIYGGTSCTNQFPRGLNVSGAATCASVADADLTGTVGYSHGGTGLNYVSQGSLPYGATASSYGWVTAGSAGQALFSNETSAPTFQDVPRITRIFSDYTNSTTSMTATALTWTTPNTGSNTRSGFSCPLAVKSSTTTLGTQVDVQSSVAPSSSTYMLTWISAAGTPPSTAGTQNVVVATADSTALGPTAGLTSYTIWRLEGVIQHTTSVSTVTIRAKASGAGTVTIAGGSYCTYYAY